MKFSTSPAFGIIAFMLVLFNAYNSSAQCNINAYILDWNGPYSFCSGDGQSDIFGPGIISVGSSGQNQAFVITDDTGIIQYAGGNFFAEIEGSAPCVCYFYSCNYQDGLTGLSPGLNIAGLVGCYDLSDPVIITKLEAGCLDPAACNYNPNAACNGGECLYNGCTDPLACNYSPGRGIDDGSCVYAGCTDINACNYNPQAGCDDASCTYPCPGFDCDNNCLDTDNDNMCDYLEIPGCTDPLALNYNSLFTEDDGTCVYPQTLCGLGTIWDALSGTCICETENPCPADINNDTIINTADLLLLLSVFGSNCQ
jgi:hypothetical protein